MRVSSLASAEMEARKVCLMPRFSTMVSMMRSLFLKAAMSVTKAIFGTTEGSMRLLAFSSVGRRWFQRITSYPSLANISAMEYPIVPAPAMVIFLIVIKKTPFFLYFYIYYSANGLVPSVLIVIRES
jgi:hypothetical protein